MTIFNPPRTRAANPKYRICKVCGETYNVSATAPNVQHYICEPCTIKAQKQRLRAERSRHGKSIKDMAGSRKEKAEKVI